jgi:hypothetical protein
MKSIRCMLGVHWWKVVDWESIYGIDSLNKCRCERCGRKQWYFANAGRWYPIPQPPQDYLNREYLLGLLGMVRYTRFR